MMALYCKNVAEEDNEFARRMGVLLQEMVAAYDDRVYFIRELEAMPGIAAAVKTAKFLNDALWKDDRRIQRLRKLQMDADLMAYEKENLSVMCGYHDVSCGFRITVLMEISEDLRMAREINALCARATAIVDERESFVDELDMLAGRPVPGKMAEFMRQVQGKDISNLMKLQILKREFEPRAQEKGVFIEKLKGNVNSQKHEGSKQVRFKQLGPGVETGFHGVHDEKRVWFEVELQGAQGDHEAEEQEKEYQTGWKIKTGNVLDSCNQRSTQQCIKSGVAKHLGVARIQQQNGLVDETNVTLFAKKPINMLGFFGWLASIKQGMLEPFKVKCIFLRYHKIIVGNKLWRLDDVTSMVVLYRNIGFNKSGEYKKTFIGSGVGTGSVLLLHGFEFEVEPLGDHIFKVEVQTQDFMDYRLARDREQHLACELSRYREDSNEAAFAVAAVENIYAHESLTFNDTVACEVISKWKAGLKEDMDVRSDAYVLNNGCRKSSDDNHDYYWEYAPAKGNILGLEIIRDQSGNTLRVSQSRIHNEKLVQTLLEGHSIMSLEDSLSGDCDVEKNGSLKANLQHMEALSTTEADI
ncbi:hypothetical protein Tco_1016553 [Tanacetum coccineum]|uniref:Zinc finger, CCHC-type n=1 Tax=Tanacetum coccineum TaxID=301880 RepID=A0ABQ5FQ93_9ASTR